MPHKQWEDLLPFYAAQTLPRREALALERHLAECLDCRRSLDEWQAIAAAVRAEAARQAAQLPPLSPRIRATPQGLPANGFRRGAYTQSPPAQRRRLPRLSPTLAAVAAIVIVFGGVMALMASRPDDLDGTSVAAAPGVTLTPLADATTTPPPTGTLAGSAQTSGMGGGFDSGSQDLGILPSYTPAPTQTSRPSGGMGVPQPATQAGSPRPAVTPSPTPNTFAPSAGPLLPSPTAYVCTARSASGDDVRVFAEPGSSQAQVGFLRAGESARVISALPGWYEVLLPGGGFGWVPAALIWLNGPCDTLLSPTPTAVYPPATPTAFFDDASGYALITTEAVGDLPANTRVRISHLWYDGSTWFYFVVAEDEVRMGEVRQSQLAWLPGYTPGPTPVAQFSSSIGMGYLLMTTQAVGDIPANTRVRISHASYDGQGWIYFVVAEDETRMGEARENQLTYAPNVTPGPTPTAQFGSYIGGVYTVITGEAVGAIPAYTYVRIASARFNGTTWIYSVATDGGITADARQDQLAFAPHTAPNPTPTAVYNSFIGSGSRVLTTQTVGSIPASTEVSITYGRYDDSVWWYGILTADGRSAEAREDQITAKPNATPTTTAIP